MTPPAAPAAGTAAPWAGRRAARWLPLVPAALLVAVALVQIRLAHAEGLTPWKGGGFGMFAATDRGLNRTLRVWIAGPDRDQEMAVPRELVDAARRALVLPTAERLDSLALEVAGRAGPEGGPVTRARVAVWRPAHDARTLAAVPELVRERNVEVPPGTP